LAALEGAASPWDCKDLRQSKIRVDQGGEFMSRDRDL